MSFTFKQSVLDNGLTVIAEIDPSAHSSGVGFFVKTGARDEERELMGVSHFLEHMMFKGTESRSAAQVDLDFDSIGADHNAYTTSELTAFWAHTLPEQLPRATEILADIMRPAIRPDDFSDEKSVILEEIAMYDDQPFWRLYERAMEVYYKSFPLAHRVLGTRDTVTELTREQMAAYFEDRYSADNTVVALAGALDFDTACRQIESLCGHWQTTETARRYTEPMVADESFTLTSDTINRHYGLMILPGPPLQDDRRYAASMLARILGGPVGSRLYWGLIEEGLAEEAQAEFEGRDQIGEYIVFFVCPPEDAGEVERITVDCMMRLPETLEEDDLARVRSKAATSVALQGELPAGRMQRLGRQWAYFGAYRSLEEELERMRAVTIDDLRSVYAAYPMSPVVTAHLTPSSATQPSEA